MDVVDKMAALPTRGLGPFAGDVPNPLVVIDSANVVGEASANAPAPTQPAAPATEPAKKPGGKKG
jgi:peptidyl-prolyl cis-trans isomerase A (cyclophilin A)